MLGCAEELVSEYVDGDLSPAAAREMERHLWACAKCREVFLDLRALIAGIRLVARGGTRRSPPHADAALLRDPFGRGPDGGMVS
jgi:anti-sigma factor RsiW